MFNLLSILTFSTGTWTWKQTPGLFDKVIETQHKESFQERMRHFDKKEIYSLTANTKGMVGSIAEVRYDLQQSQYRVDQLPYNRFADKGPYGKEFQKQHFKNLRKALDDKSSMIYVVDYETNVVLFDSGPTYKFWQQ